MSSFDHLEIGTPEQAWQMEQLATLPMLSEGSRIIVLAAHPDDETLGAGGLIAACAGRGLEIDVVVASDGGASHPQSPTTSPEQLMQIRRIEVQAALDVLAPAARLHFLAFPDGELMTNLSGLTESLQVLAPEATHVISPWEGDRHPDHAACAVAAAQLAQGNGIHHWQYPIWAWHWADPNSDDIPRNQLHRIELSPQEVALKRQAMAVHESQHTALSDAPGDEAILSAPMLAHFFERPFETFITNDIAPAATTEYFDDLYRDSLDPWNLEDHFYEKRKRQLQLAVLPYQRFRRAFEPGCATGLLTEKLVDCCESVVAWDVNERALEQSRIRLAGAADVSVERGKIPDDWPAGKFDLIVLSEVGYYCVDLARLVHRIQESLDDDGVLLACHWRHPARDHPHSAAAVHRALGQGLCIVASHVEDDFLLDVWSRTGRSVASLQGIVS